MNTELFSTKDISRCKSFKLWKYNTTMPIMFFHLITIMFTRHLQVTVNNSGYQKAWQHHC
jgi:hypothetical protein